MSDQSVIERKPDSRARVMGALAGAIIWSLHLVVSYGLVEIACRFDLFAARFFGLSLLVILVLLATVVAAVATAYVAWVTYRAWQALYTRQQQGETINLTHLFIVQVGTYLNTLFLIVILLSGLPAPLLAPCH